jgi:hypothetical protein
MRPTELKKAIRDSRDSKNSANQMSRSSNSRHTNSIRDANKYDPGEHIRKAEEAIEALGAIYDYMKPLKISDT